MPELDTMEVGEVAVWAVKDFSVQLRKLITDAARRQNCTVADFLHRHFHKYGIDGLEAPPVQPVKSNGQTGAAREAVPVDLQEAEALWRLAEAAARVAETAERMPKNLRSTLTKSIHKAAKDHAPPPKPRPPQLIHQPKPETEEV
jgi:hypothetical protein